MSKKWIKLRYRKWWWHLFPSCKKYIRDVEELLNTDFYREKISEEFCKDFTDKYTTGVVTKHDDLHTTS